MSTHNMKKEIKNGEQKKSEVKGGTEVRGVSSRITPLGSRVLVKPFTKAELETKNSFGIILPSKDDKEKAEQGKVIAVGPGDLHDGVRVPVSVRVGDTVAFSRYGYEEITVNGEEYYLIKEDSILAIIN